ncbi:MAG: rod shape-determining protein MreC [Nitrospiraceae bacterium]|nr:rod shape-determining protein MreC [Nitrospiraceae bacterium]
MVITALLVFVAIGLHFNFLAIVSPLEEISMDFSGYLQKGLSGPPRWGRYLWRSYLALHGTELENEALRREVARLQREIVQYREALIANARLKRLLKIKRNVKNTTVTANVVGVDMAPWAGTITIDQGRKDGIRPTMVVLSGAGVVGQVIKSSFYFSKVLLLSDYNSAVAAFVQRDRVRGILRGRGQGRCRLAYVGKAMDVEAGDKIITSGADQIFPKGLLLGTVSSVTQGSASDLFQVIKVTPAVDFKKVEEVLILIKTRSIMRSRH